jgi:hypothetical protein
MVDDQVILALVFGKVLGNGHRKRIQYVRHFVLTSL